MSSTADNIIEFLSPINLMKLSNDEGFIATQIGKNISAYEETFPDIERADLIILGMSEARGASLLDASDRSADAVRREFYQLFQWHYHLKIVDIGNIILGKTLKDSYAALRIILSELQVLKAKVLILGGSRDLTLSQCDAFAHGKQLFDLTCVDAKINLDADSTIPAEKFLIDLFMREPNFLRHYNHIGFQSYFVHPRMLETIDKLRFDCFRVGIIKDYLETVEPNIRASDIFSFDIAAIQNSHAPANLLTPNGFTGEEACALFRYAGMSRKLRSIGIYGYFTHLDKQNMTAKQISHLMWYLLDGIYQGKYESSLDDRQNFNEFHLAFADMKTIFLQSKKTNRWWMQLPNDEFIPCNYSDYILATRNEIPERWLRAIERR
jgi:arginase family enzyme